MQCTGVYIGIYVMYVVMFVIIGIEYTMHQSLTLSKIGTVTGWEGLMSYNCPRRFGGL